MLAPHCWPPVGAEAITTCKLVLAMRGAGWRVDVLTQSGMTEFYPSDDSLSAVQPSVISLPRWPGSPHRPTDAKRRLAARLASVRWCICALKEARELIRTNRYDAVISRATPLYGHLPALLLGSAPRPPWIACWSDPLPAAKAPPPYGGGPRSRRDLAATLYCRAISRRADWHVFPSRRLHAYMARYLPRCSRRGSAIPHVALTGPPPSRGRPSRPFTLVHIGSLVRRQLAVALAGFREFAATREGPPDTVFELVGSFGDEDRRLVTSSDPRGIVRMLSPEPYSAVLDRIAASDVAVVIEADCAEGIFMPSKITDYIQAGTPILAVSPRPGTLDDLLTSLGGGLVADCKSPTEVAAALSALFRARQGGTLFDHYSVARLAREFAPERVLQLFDDAIRAAGRARSSHGQLPPPGPGADRASPDPGSAAEI